MVSRLTLTQEMEVRFLPGLYVLVAKVDKAAVCKTVQRIFRSGFESHRVLLLNGKIAQRMAQFESASQITSLRMLPCTSIKRLMRLTLYSIMESTAGFDPAGMGSSPIRAVCSVRSIG